MNSQRNHSKHQKTSNQTQIIPWKGLKSQKFPGISGNLQSPKKRLHYIPPEIFHIDTKNGPYFKGATFSKAHHFGALHVSFRGCNSYYGILKVRPNNRLSCGGPLIRPLMTWMSRVPEVIGSKVIGSMGYNL